MIEVYEKNDIEAFDTYAQSIDFWAQLWWADLEEAGVTFCYLAFDKDKVVAFQTVSENNRCVAIEVHPDYRGQRISNLLIEESECFRPEANENKNFWAAMEVKFGEGIDVA